MSERINMNFTKDQLPIKDIHHSIDNSTYATSILVLAHQIHADTTAKDEDKYNDDRDTCILIAWLRWRCADAWENTYSYNINYNYDNLVRQLCLEVCNVFMKHITDPELIDIGTGKYNNQKLPR